MELPWGEVTVTEMRGLWSRRGTVSHSVGWLSQKGPRGQDSLGKIRCPTPDLQDTALLVGKEIKEQRGSVTHARHTASLWWLWPARPLPFWTLPGPRSLGGQDRKRQRDKRQRQTEVCSRGVFAACTACRMGK